MPGSLAGKVAIVTGARQGIGRQSALEFARHGACVVVHARTHLSDTVAHVRAEGGSVVGVEGDLTDPAVRSRVVDHALAEFGRIDLLMNNAAYTSGPGMDQSLDDLSLAEWERQFLVNVHVPLALAQAVVPHMRKVGGGVIINVTSPAAELQEITRGQGRGPFGPLLGYSTTKAALNRMSNALAADLEADDIAVIAFDPGLVRTETAEVQIVRAGWDPAIAGSPRDTARHVVALASSGMTWSGQIVRAQTLIGTPGE